MVSRSYAHVSITYIVQSHPIARPRSHGFPLSLRLDGLRPAGHFPQLHKHTRHPLERPLVLDGARASVFGRAFCLPASLSLRCVGRLGWVFVSPAPMGAGANRPPFTGGQLTYGVPYGVLVDVLPPAASVRWRLRPSQRSRSRCRRRVYGAPAYTIGYKSRHV